MKILFLTSRFPYPLEKGDKLRAYEFIKHLSKQHQIILLALNEKKITQSQLQQLQPYCEEIIVEEISRLNSFINLLKNIIGYLPFSVVYFFRRSVYERIQLEIEKHKPDHIFCHLIRMSEYVAHVDNIPKTLDYMDAFSTGMTRLSEQSSGIKRFLYNMEQKRLEQYEQRIFPCFNHHTIISKQDRDLIPVEEKLKIHIVPNGVDLAFFVPQQSEKKYDLLFAGNMNYPPNIESVLFIAQKILPLVKQKLPNIKLVVAGANPSSKIKELQSENIDVTGWVDDIRPYFSQSKIMLAPMLISIGMQNKILQGMAMKIPCITTQLANNAIEASNGTEVIIANTAEEFANAIIDLLNDESKQNKIAENAFTFVNKNYTWQAMTEKLNALFSGSGNLANETKDTTPNTTPITTPITTQQ